MKSNKIDAVIKEITDKVISNLENLPTDAKWSKPWSNKGATFGAHYNPVTGTVYSGFNFLITNLSGFECKQWVTFNQLKDKFGMKDACKFTKGNKTTPIVHFSMVPDSRDPSGDTLYPKRTLFRLYNVSQLNDFDTSVFGGENEAGAPEIPTDGVNLLADQLGVDLRYQGNMACFIPSVDRINMPTVESFIEGGTSRDHHDSTLLHEITHWTGHESRLNRKLKTGFGSKDYAFEELVAELGSAMAGALMGLPYEGLQHAEYIQSWIKSLKDNPKALIDASKLANKAVRYMIDNGARLIEREITIKQVA
tara:strand:+ start:951 stop:1874 length:924 start_codon:yes stop_codon:yes gene_type:complete